MFRLTLSAAVPVETVEMVEVTLARGVVGRDIDD